MSLIAPPEPPSERIALGELTFVHWPLRDDPRLALAVVATIVGLVAYAATVTAGGPATVIVLFALAAASWTAVLPVRYVFDATGIERGVFFWRRRIPWAAIAHCDEWPRGIRLFRTSDPRPLDALGSVFVPFAGRKQAVLEQIERRALRCSPHRTA